MSAFFLQSQRQQRGLGQASRLRIAHRGSGRRVRKGCCGCVAIAIQNAAMQAISPSNVSSIMQICLFRCRGDHCKKLFLMSLSSRTKAFSRGEGGALPAMMLSSIESVRNRLCFESVKRRWQCDGRGQANLSALPLLVFITTFPHRFCLLLFCQYPRRPHETDNEHPYSYTG